MSTTRFYRRRFLNRRGHHAGAYVLAECKVETYRRCGETAQHSVDADITVADCRHILTLDFCADDEASARNSLHKARLLRDVVVEFTATLEAAVAEWRDLERPRD